MSPESFLKFISEFPGVVCAALLNPSGQVIHSSAPELGNEKILQAAHENGLALLNTFSEGMPETNEACVHFSKQTVYVQNFGDYFLVLCLNEMSLLRSMRAVVNSTKKKVDAFGLEVEHKPATSTEKRYEVENVIGTGGSALVFKAWDKRFKRHVALKRFNEESSGRNAADSDYESEVNTLSKISHPHVVRAYDLDKDEEGQFIILELIEGINLEERISQNGPLDATDIRPLATQLLEALIAVHHCELLHLDIKPANLMVTETPSSTPRYTLVDFGRACDKEREIARRELAEKDSLLGSIHYMAPEQMTKASLDPRTDLYATGISIYEALTGKRPFDGVDTLQVMSAHLVGKVVPLIEERPELPEALCNWVMSLIATDPANRPVNAAAALKSFNELDVIKVISDTENEGDTKDSIGLQEAM